VVYDIVQNYFGHLPTSQLSSITRPESIAEGVVKMVEL
jgi:hypothetical protein